MLTRAPKRMRERISRPNSSFPNGWFQEGPSKRFISCWSAGSYGVSHGANTATNAKAVTITNPASASLFFLKKSVISNARVYDRIQQVRRQIDQNVGQCYRQNASLHERIVPGIDRLNRKATQPRP